MAQTWSVSHKRGQKCACAYVCMCVWKGERCYVYIGCDYLVLTATNQGGASDWVKSDSGSDSTWKMRLIDWHWCPCSCICVCMCRHGFHGSECKMDCWNARLCVLRMLNLTSIDGNVLFVHLHDVWTSGVLCEIVLSAAHCQCVFVERIQVYLPYETTWVLQAIRGLLRCVPGRYSLYDYYGKP